MNGSNQLMIISHLTLRWLLGALGVLLPIILAVVGFVQCDCLEIQPSLSHYYDLDRWARDFFVGILFAIATFLWAYRGYGLQDKVFARLGSAFAVGVALFPYSGADWVRVLHFLSAGLLFSVFAYFALVLFTRSTGDPTPEKKIRNRIYVTCGTVIVLCVLLIILMHLPALERALSGLKPVFWLESIALWAFGISWFVKGGTLWADAALQPSRGEVAS